MVEVLFVLLAASASAQEAPTVETGVVAPPVAALPASFGEGWWWSRVGLLGHRVTGVAVLPEAPGAWAAIDADGAVWLTLDAGGSFTSVLDPLRIGVETDPRKRIESRIQELVDQLKDQIASQSYADEAALTALQREIDALQDQLAEIGLDDADPTAGLDGIANLPRVWFADGALYAGREDGLWRTADLGGRWERVLDLPTRGLAAVPGRALFAAGTSDGMRFSVDGIVWIDPEDGTEGLGVYDLAPSADGVWAATASGVWFAPDAQTWERRSDADELLRVTADPAWPTGAWVSSGRAVLRTDDGGETLQSPRGAPIPGVLSILPLGPGRLLVSGSDGVWETGDGGTTWQPRARGLTDPHTHALAIEGATVLLASDEGLFRLAPGEPERRQSAAAQESFVELGFLLERATGREELNQSTGNRWGATLMPKLTLTGGWAQVSAVQWYLSTGTDQAGGSGWFGSGKLTWTPRSRSSLDDALLPVDALYVVDDGPMSGAFGAASSRDVNQYKVAIVQEISSLYFTRAEFVRERPTDGSLLERIQHELRIQEIDARLDVLCDGSVSAWSQGSSSPKETR